MQKSYYRLVFSLLFIFLLSLTACESVSVKTTSPVPNEEEVKKASASLPSPRFPESIINTMDAEYNWSVKDLSGKTVNAGDWKNKVLVLNMWATWCGPCIAEMPSLESLYEKTKNDDIVFALVSDEDQETVNQFIQKRKFSLPVYTVENLPQIYRGDAIPRTLIIAANGKIVFDHLGAAKWDSETTINFLKTVSQIK
ncbi:MAG: TlpA family protein disulfide reductase [Blastocatellia bacterium]|nr:TlpA family protein disulfide reductase [Blastocatellia bacterium]